MVIGHRLVSPAPLCSWPLVAAYIPLVSGGTPPLPETAPVTPVCVCGAAAGNSCVRPLRAACLMSAVVPLAALDQARVWRYQSIVPSTVYTPGGCMLLWRAGACSHDGLTYQALLPCSKGCHGTPVLAAMQCSVHQGTEALLRRVWLSSWHPLRAHLTTSPST